MSNVWEERQRQKAISDSTSQLNLIIERWTEKKRIQEFFDQLELDIEKESVPTAERDKLLERLDEARKLAQPEEPLRLLSEWKTPDELMEK